MRSGKSSSSFLSSALHMLRGNKPVPVSFLEEKELDVGNIPPIEHPLFVASQGGGGHIAAIKALIKRHEQLTKHEVQIPCLLASSPNWRAKTLREVGSVAANMAMLGTLLTKYDIMPEIPVMETFQAEAKKLMDALPNDNFVCALRHPHGIVGAFDAVIWNFLQAAEKTEQLQLLLARQEDSDKTKYEAAFNFFYNELKESRKTNTPYTKIVSSQAMTLSAMCDAVIKYNNENKHIKGFTPIYIEQYLTDFATEGAVHFFGSLGRLTREQRQVMKLYAVGPLREMLHNSQIDVKNKGQFLDAEEIKPEHNPMVRPGFSKPQLEFAKDSVTLQVQEQDKSKRSITIPHTATVATIMLGSQAGIATIDYAVTSIQSIMSESKNSEREFHLFVLAGNKQQDFFKSITEKLGKPIPQNIKLHMLANQEDAALGAIEARTNIKIQRAGGLSGMEATLSGKITTNPSWPLKQPKVIFVHHSGKTKEGVPTSGIKWEDANRDEMKKELAKVNIPVISTTVADFSNDLTRVLKTVLSPVTINPVGKTETTTATPLVQKPLVKSTNATPAWFLKPEQSSVRIHTGNVQPTNMDAVNVSVENQPLKKCVHTP